MLSQSRRTLSDEAICFLFYFRSVPYFVTNQRSRFYSHPPPPHTPSPLPPIFDWNIMLTRKTASGKSYSGILPVFAVLNSSILKAGCVFSAFQLVYFFPNPDHPSPPSPCTCVCVCLIMRACAYVSARMCEYTSMRFLLLFCFLVCFFRSFLHSFRVFLFCFVFCPSLNYNLN